MFTFNAARSYVECHQGAMGPTTMKSYAMWISVSSQLLGVFWCALQVATLIYQSAQK